MKQISFFTVLVAAALIGCHHPDTVYTGADGSSVTVSGNGTHIEATGKDGTKVTENVNGGDVTVKNDKGESLEAGAGKVTEADLGLPFYPGSQENAGGSMMMNAPKEKDVISTRTTPDDPDKVIAFYKDKFTKPSNSSTSSNGQIMDTVVGKLADGSDASVMVSKTGSKDTTVEISVKHTKSS